MRKINIIIIIYFICLFIPYYGALQYLSHLLLVFVVILFKDYYKFKPILYLYGYGVLVFCIQYIFITQEVYLYNYFLSLLYAPLILLLFSSRKLDDHTINLDKIIKIVFLLYALLLWYQALTNWYIPEFVSGVHGLIKGPHLNSKIYLLLSGFVLFQKGFKNKLYALFFLLTGLLGEYNLATLVFFICVILVVLLSVEINKKFFKLFVIASLILFIGAITIYIVILEERAYFLDVIYAVSMDLEYSGKITFIYDFFTDYTHQNIASFIIGTSPGNGGSRVALLLTDNYLSVDIPKAFICESLFVKENVYPFIHTLSDYTRGTINQPFSSIVALLSEYGMIVGIIFITYLYRYYNKIKVKNIYSHKYVVINLFIWLLLDHTLELLPFIVLFHLLMLSNKK